MLGGPGAIKMMIRKIYPYQSPYVSLFNVSKPNQLLEQQKEKTLADPL